ncbi:MAG: gamma-glutamyl-gamma-aminobutyrate hydrolase family protein [Chloroflexi bacterium]|nr:gamma-glutamyl-gamma-aminobutyrate hydrolase family protein [Chloroflexota bacterium]
MPLIAITSSPEEPVDSYVACVRDAGGEPLVVSMTEPFDACELLNRVDGLLLTGGADVEPSRYGQATEPAAHVHARPERDAQELPLIRAAVQRDMPVLGICRGMQALNVAMGGSLLQDIPNHRARDENTPLKHDVFVPPGCRLTHILGVGGFMRVNSFHHQGLKLAQKAPELLVSAFSMKDGIIEALDSPSYRHRWVVGVQWHPERRDEVPAHMRKLFTGLVFAAQETRSKA